jgi:hypothetical protein
MDELSAIDTNAATQTEFTLPSASYRARSILPFEFVGQGQRRPSMQEAADAMMWETFHGPGPTDQVMLPPQPSRDEATDGRKVSFGQPLQLVDSNVVLPYQGKGKGRAIDYDPAQQFSAWENANIGGDGSFNVPGLENQLVPMQELYYHTSQFTFVPGQFEAWQPENTTGLQPQMQGQSTDIHPQIPQAPQGQTLPSMDPQIAQPAQHDLTPAMKWHLQAQLPLQQAFQPPPGFPQQPASPGRNFYPGSELQQLNVEMAPPANIQPLPPAEIPMRSGYHFEPGRGFVCNVCSACVRQPGIHRFQDHNFWCYADGPEMCLDDEVDVQRWPKRNKRAKRAKMELYIP